MKKAQIREIFLQAGFTIKEGQSDLKPYVYEAAADLLRARDEEEASQPLRDRLKDAMGAYLRVCSSGGMPKTTRLTIENAFSEALRLGYFDEILRLARAECAPRADVGKELTVMEKLKGFARHAGRLADADQHAEAYQTNQAPEQKGMTGCGKCDDDPAECAWHQQCLAEKETK